MNILFFGDVVGRTGRRLISEHTAALAQEHDAAFVIANVENVAAGAGVTPETVAAVLRAGVDVATSGNHVFAHGEIIAAVDDMPAFLRPLNFPPGVPGRGWLLARARTGERVAVINLLGRVFMDVMDCPFRAVDAALAVLAGETDIVIVDFHAEATSEKEAMAHYLDGRVTAVVGTHTHVQTADERILPRGTAYITDVGMTGPADGVIGTAVEPVLRRFLTRTPARFSPAKGKGILCAALISVDPATGKASAIKRIQIREAKDEEV